MLLSVRLCSGDDTTSSDSRWYFGSDGSEANAGDTGGGCGPSEEAAGRVDAPGVGECVRGCIVAMGGSWAGLLSLGPSTGDVRRNSGLAGSTDRNEPGKSEKRADGRLARHEHGREHVQIRRREVGWLAGWLVDRYID